MASGECEDAACGSDAVCLSNASEDSKGGRVVFLLFVTWLAANGLTHAIVAATTGGIYYQLPFRWLNVAEASISLLNLLLPILVGRYVLREPFSFRETFGWQWTGWKIPALGFAGFVVFMLLCTFSNRLFANQMISYATPGGAGPASQLDRYMLMAMLLTFLALGEETMFRGFLQTRLTAMYGTILGILVPAALFAMRHHPTDIYFGVANHTPLAGWENRALQLYGSAVLFGLVRHFARSTWASWMMHTMILLLIVFMMT